MAFRLARGFPYRRFPVVRPDRVLGCGLWFQAGASGGLTGRDTARLLVLILGGVLGLAITVATAWQTVAWWNYVSGGTEVWQGPEGWHIWLLAGLFVVGLALMFASLLLARGEENENPLCRRLLYGYNAVLTGLLVLGILAALNVLAYLYLPVSSDWTEAGIYTLSSKSEETLKGLKQPVTVYVMEQMRGDRFDTEMRNLIENARSVACDKIQAEYVIRDINRDEMQRLKVLYKPSGTLGLIVVYGSGEGARHLIPESEVLPQAFALPGRQGPRGAVQGRGPADVGHSLPGGRQENPSCTPGKRRAGTVGRTASRRTATQDNCCWITWRSATTTRSRA